MDSREINTWMSLIKKVINACQEMTTLLQEDQNKFSKHDVLNFKDSDQQKLAVIGTMSACIEELKANCVPGEQKNLFAALTSKIVHIPQQSVQNEWKNLLNQLNSELEKCYHHIMTNRLIVQGNMQQLKSLWDQLNACRTDTGSVYERTGAIEI